MALDERLTSMTSPTVGHGAQDRGTASMQWEPRLSTLGLMPVPSGTIPGRKTLHLLRLDAIKMLL